MVLLAKQRKEFLNSHFPGALSRERNQIIETQRLTPSPMVPVRGRSNALVAAGVVAGICFMFSVPLLVKNNIVSPLATTEALGNNL
jgi:hypothetical protein